MLFGFFVTDAMILRSYVDFDALCSVRFTFDP